MEREVPWGGEIGRQSIVDFHPPPQPLFNLPTESPRNVRNPQLWMVGIRSIHAHQQHSIKPQTRLTLSPCPDNIQIRIHLTLSDVKFSLRRHLGCSLTFTHSLFFLIFLCLFIFSFLFSQFGGCGISILWEANNHSQAMKGKRRVLGKI